jgi:methylated-DNA-[protein]-cysteine S-methyltransferase
MFSDFSLRVFQVVKRIPRGRVLSYKKVAELAGRTGAWRAVGNILNKNQDQRIPCHRVVKSDGRIGGYNRGQKKKIELLRREGIKIRDKKIVL